MALPGRTSFFALSFFAILALLPLMAAGCTSQEDMDRDTQITAIKEHLLRKIDPATQQPYEYEEIGGIFRQFLVKSPDREGRQITGGSEFSIIFSLKTFNSSIQNTAYWTNVPGELDSLKRTNPGFRTELWPESPMNVKMGSTALSEILKKGLRGCVVGDSIRLFAPFNEAFGNEVMEALPRKSAIVYTIGIGEAVMQRSNAK